MVRKHTKRTRGLVYLTAVAMLIPLAAIMLHGVVSADENITFEVNVKESLTVAITTPTTGNWATGNAGTFLRNMVTLSVGANNSNGFTASMTTDTAMPSLENTAATSSSTISSITTSAAKSAFPSVGWGYSLEGKNSGDTVSGTDSGVYNPMVGLGAATPITVLSSNSNGSDSQNIFFGAKADYTVDAGTYVGTVVISVVTGTINANTNPTIPVDPATPNEPGDTNPDYSGAGTTTGGSSSASGTTTYTTTSTVGSVTTTTTHVDDGDTRSSYTDPAGVTKANEGTPLATGLAAASAAAAATGVVFFIIAKRRKDEEDEEEY